MLQQKKKALFLSRMKKDLKLQRFFVAVNLTKMQKVHYQQGNLLFQSKVRNLRPCMILQASEFSLPKLKHNIASTRNSTKNRP